MVASVSDAAETPRPYELWTAVFLFGLLCVRLISNTNSQIELVVNEAQYWSWSRELALGYFSKPPLLAWLIRGVSEVCGDGEPCLRSFAPFFFSVAAWFVFLTGKTLYDARIGFWSAVVFATLPQTAFLAAAVTPDVPLLLFWSIALYLWTVLLERKNAAIAALLGFFIGVGMLAKYAMIFFPIGMALQAAVCRDARETLRDRRGLLILLVALLPLVPNLYWNYANDFLSFVQTANSAGWGRQAHHLNHFVRFLLSQFLVYGPVLLVMVVWIAGAAARVRTDRRVIMLLAFSVPVLLLFTVQAAIGRTHAHWTAVVAPAICILTTAWLLERDRRVLFGLVIGTNVLATVALLIAPVLPPNAFPPAARLFERMSGWKDVAEAVRTRLAQDDYAAVLVDSRDLAGELLYYLRDSKLPLYVSEKGGPDNYFKRERSYAVGSPEPVLFVSLRGRTRKLRREFRSAEFLGTTKTGEGPRERTLHFYKLSGFAPNNGGEQRTSRVEGRP